MWATSFLPKHKTVKTKFFWFNECLLLFTLLLSILLLSLIYNIVKCKNTVLSILSEVTGYIVCVGVYTDSQGCVATELL